MVGTPTAKCTQHPGWGGMMWLDTHKVVISLKWVFLVVAFRCRNMNYSLPLDQQSFSQCYLSPLLVNSVALA